jgi:hypothetical protein
MSLNRFSVSVPPFRATILARSPASSYGASSMAYTLNMMQAPISCPLAL